MPFENPGANGSVSDTVPHLQFQDERRGGHRGWPIANGSWPGDNGGFQAVFPIALRLAFDWFGDVELLRDVFPSLVLYMAAMERTCGVVPPPFPAPNPRSVPPGSAKCGFYGDWSAPTSRFASTNATGQMISAYFTIAQWDAAATIAKALGNASESGSGSGSEMARVWAEPWAAKAEEGRRRFDSAFWNASKDEYAVMVDVTGELIYLPLHFHANPSHNNLSRSNLTYLTRTGPGDDNEWRQTYQALALALNASSSASRAEMALSALVDDINARGT